MTNLKMTVTAEYEKATFTGETVEDVASKFCEWRDKSGYGASSIGGMNTVKRGREKIARISYNGRIWSV